jgi:hypothetical protein
MRRKQLITVVAIPAGAMLLFGDMFAAQLGRSNPTGMMALIGMAMITFGTSLGVVSYVYSRLR